MSLAPELRVLCQLLTTTPPARLPRNILTIVDFVFRCRNALSDFYDVKTAKGAAAETASLVHKFKTILTTILNGRTAQGRFTAVVLIKSVIDVGGWECLKTCEPWVRGLVAVVQRHDPIASRELAIIALTRIYVLVSEYQTLSREVLTPTIPTFANACLSLVKPTVKLKKLQIPMHIVETVLEAFSTLIPLHPTTFRPFVNQLKPVLRVFVAPTDADDFMVPDSLQQAARRLAITIHHTAPKNGGSDDWARLVRETVAYYHQTADQVFRAVNETWEPKTEHATSKIDFDQEACGGGYDVDQYPAWKGVHSGSLRLIGLLRLLSDTLRYPTRASVTIPIAVYMDVIARSTQLVKSSPKTQSWEQAVEVKAIATREEKDELWSAAPEIHVAALQLLQTMFERLRISFVSLVPESLDYITRVFKSSIAMASVRIITYSLIAPILTYAGPTMPKSTVSLLDTIVSACCRDLQEHKGVFKPSAKINTKKISVAKNGTAANADLFIKGVSKSHIVKVVLSPQHYVAVKTLLSVLISKLPQQHIKPALRGLLDQTAIATSDKSAMLNSVLFPYRDHRGKLYPNILPYLSQQYPQDQGVEVLRTNLRTTPHSSSSHFATIENAQNIKGSAEEDENGAEEASNEETTIESINIETIMEKSTEVKKTLFAKRPAEQTAPNTQNAFGVIPSSSVKRKLSQSELNPTASKRPIVSNPVPVLAAPVDMPVVTDEYSGSDNESVHLNMDLDSDDG